MYARSTGTSTSFPRYLWEWITCHCPWYLLKAHMSSSRKSSAYICHDDVIKWKHFPCYWPFVRGTPVTGGFPSQRPVTQSFDIFLHLRLNKRLNKQLRRRWFDTPSRSFWRHCNVYPFCDLFPLSHQLRLFSYFEYIPFPVYLFYREQKIGIFLECPVCRTGVPFINLDQL